MSTTELITLDPVRDEADSTTFVLKPHPIRTKADMRRLDCARKPNWRFKRVLEMVEHQPRAGRCRASDDAAVRDMRAFMLELHPSNEAKREDVYVKYPGPFHALQMHQSDDFERRLMIECRLLCRQNDEEIADAVHCAPEAIYWYELMFFNVRDRLHSKDWIFREILGQARHRNLANNELPMKLFSYYGGVKAMEFYFTGMRDVPMPQTPDDVDKYVSDHSLSGLNRRASMAVYTFEVNKYNVMSLFELVRQVRADIRALQDQELGQDVFASAASATLQAIQFMKGDKAEDYLRKNAPDLMIFDNYAAELRDTELHSVTAGYGKDLKRLESIKMPPAAVRTLVNKDDEL